MARLETDHPIETFEPRLRVEAGLLVGRHRFRLDVIDESGRRSRPDIVTVEVRGERGAPTRAASRPSITGALTLAAVIAFVGAVAWLVYRARD